VWVLVFSHDISLWICKSGEANGFRPNILVTRVPVCAAGGWPIMSAGEKS